MHTCEDCSHRGLCSRYVVYSRCVTRCYISPFCKRSRVSAFTPFRFPFDGVAATPRGKSDAGGVGCWAGAVEQNRGPQLPSLRLIQRSERCICTDSHPAPTAERRRIPQLPSLRLIPRSERCICTDFPLRRLPNAAAFSVVRCTAIPPRRSRGCHRSSLRLLLPSPSAPACGPRFEKFRHTAAPDTPRLCSRLHRHRPILPDELLHTNGTQNCPTMPSRTGNIPFTSHKPVSG
jgi:hypothetical protein